MIHSEQSKTSKQLNPKTKLKAIHWLALRSEQRWDSRIGVMPLRRNVGMSHSIRLGYCHAEGQTDMPPRHCQLCASPAKGDHRMRRMNRYNQHEIWQTMVLKESKGMLMSKLLGKRDSQVSSPMKIDLSSKGKFRSEIYNTTKYVHLCCLEETWNLSSSFDA